FFLGDLPRSGTPGLSASSGWSTVMAPRPPRLLSRLCPRSSTSAEMPRRSWPTRRGPDYESITRMLLSRLPSVMLALPTVSVRLAPPRRGVAFPVLPVTWRHVVVPYGNHQEGTRNVRRRHDGPRAVVPRRHEPAPVGEHVIATTVEEVVVRNRRCVLHEGT